MYTHTILFSLLVAGIASGQTNLVQNADFEANSLTPWIHDGNATHNAFVETYDIDGDNTPTRCIACTPYTTAFTVKQGSVPVVQGVTYLFRMNLASYWPNPNSASYQSDAGRFTVTLGSQQVYYVSLGTVYASAPTIRRTVAVTFQASTTGMVDLAIAMHRIYNGRYGLTPRCYVDDVELRMVPTAKPYGTACGSTTFRAEFDAAHANLTQVVYTGKAGCLGLLLLGTQKLEVPFLGCRILTDAPIQIGYRLDSNGLWTLQAPMPKDFRGPVNLQHFVKLPDDTIEATQGVAIGL